MTGLEVFMSRLRWQLVSFLGIAGLATLCSCGTQGQRVAGVGAEADAAFAAPAFGDPFWSHWGDGKAEMTGYDLRIPRYGEVRRGTAVAIFVTETFSQEDRVKADPGQHAAADEFPVMKLNLVEDFPTGIYDYNVMTSSFLALEPVVGRLPGSLTKVSYTSQEWCGHVYSQLLFGGELQHTLHSYFDGEADQQNTLPYPGAAVSEDALWFWARGLAAPALAPGESIRVPLLPSLQRARFSHGNLAWRTATLSRAAQRVEVTVPAGTFPAEELTVRIEPGPEGGEESRTFYVETAAPRRIVSWEGSDGEFAEMLASERLSYWQMNGGEFVKEVQRLGLAPRPPKTP